MRKVGKVNKKSAQSMRHPVKKGKGMIIRHNKSDWTSSGYSGYARVSQPGTFTEVYAEWRVPPIRTSTTGDQVAVNFWVGIDGFGSGATKIQIGTRALSIYGFVPTYSTFYQVQVSPDTPTEGGPDPATHPLKYGDKVSGEVAHQIGNIWRVSLTNRTRNWQYTQYVYYNGPAATVEFIVERPDDYTLADYGEVFFDNCRVNNQGANLDVSERGLMLDDSGATFSYPSVPTSDGLGFAVAYGATEPSAPIDPPNGKGRVKTSKKGSMMSKRIGNSTLSVPSFSKKHKGYCRTQK